MRMNGFTRVDDFCTVTFKVSIVRPFAPSSAFFGSWTPGDFQWGFVSKCRPATCANGFSMAAMAPDSADVLCRHFLSDQYLPISCTHPIFGFLLIQFVRSACNSSSPAIVVKTPEIFTQGKKTVTSSLITSGPQEINSSFVGAPNR